MQFRRENEKANNMMELNLGPSKKKQTLISIPPKKIYFRNKKKKK